MSAPTATQHLDLPIEGMTCASCAVRIERTLNTLDGVEATVNYATERATVSFDGERVTPGELIAAIEAAGYAARLPAPDQARGCAGEWSSPPLSRHPCSRWRWSRRCSSTAGSGSRSCSPRPSCSGPGFPFHSAAWRNLRHGATTMDTLVSLGTLAAWGWSSSRSASSRGRDAHAVQLDPRDAQRHDLLRGRRRRHDIHPPRPLLRGACQAPLGRGAAGAARARRQGRRAARRRRTGAPHSRSASFASAIASSSARARRSPPTASSRKATPRSIRRC